MMLTASSKFFSRPSKWRAFCSLAALCVVQILIRLPHLSTLLAPYHNSNMEKTAFLLSVAIETSNNNNSSSSVQPTTNNNTLGTKDDELEQVGYPTVEHVPLLSWEIESAVNQSSCRPPEGIPKYCCMGSSSSGTEVDFRTGVCKERMQSYEKVKQKSLQFLKEHPVIVNSSRARQCDICQIVDSLIENNLTLAFQGDSMTRQTFIGLECELLRRGFHVKRNVQKWQKRKGLPWNYGHTDTSVLNIGRHESDDEGPSRTRIYYYGMYRPLPNMSEVVEVVDKSDIVVFDHGLHFQPNEQRLFIEMMSSVMNTTNRRRKGKLKLLAWRETSSQHFNTHGGHYRRGKIPGKGCFPMREGKDGYRYSWAIEAAKRVGFTMLNISDPLFRSPPSTIDELIILPFRQYTNDLEELHPGMEGRGNDCTHFCSTPYLWLPIWRSLRLAMDRVL